MSSQSCLDTLRFEKSLKFIEKQEHTLKIYIEKRNIVEGFLQVADGLLILRQEMHSTTPKVYYHLYKKVLVSLLSPFYCFLLEAFTRQGEKHSSENPSTGVNTLMGLRDLYDLVQARITLVLPRLYLMVLIGSLLCLLFTKQDKNHPMIQCILKDLLQSAHALQNPLAGLFLRHYFNRALKDLGEK